MMHGPLLCKGGEFPSNPEAKGVSYFYNASVYKYLWYLKYMSVLLIGHSS